MASKTTGVLEEEEAKMRRLPENSHSVPQHEAESLGGNYGHRSPKFVRMNSQQDMPWARLHSNAWHRAVPATLGR